MTAVTDRPVDVPDAGGDFRHRAACRVGVDPELFFPATERGAEHDAQVSAARAVCTGCPVLAQCREWALAGLPDGVAGGMTATERRTERARRRTVRVLWRRGQDGATPCTAEGSRGGNRAPLLISQQHNTQAGTRTTEGHRG